MAKKKEIVAKFWRDDTERFPDDWLLRRLGWTILERQGRQDPTWQIRLPNGRILKEKHSVLIRQIADAERGM